MMGPIVHTSASHGVVLPMLFITTALVSSASACLDDLDCSLNGVCSGGNCVCAVPWMGTTCALLNRTAAPNRGIFGFSPNITSTWGGNVLRDDNGTFHLYVSEIDGGLTKFIDRSQVAHAVSANVEGPYTKLGEALGIESHNPQAVRYSADRWLIYHIGNAVPPAQARHNGSGLHSASSPFGPWSPVAAYHSMNCNNPSPWVLANKTILLLCTWEIYTAPKPEGPYTVLPQHGNTLSNLNTNSSCGHASGRCWEDPFLFQDERGHWHILSHTYTEQGAGPLNSISGHLFARDVHGPWTVSPVEPYSNIVRYTDGTEQTFSTVERPKLVFNERGVPTHLINGVSPVYPCDSCGGGPPGQGWCCWCKLTAGLDYTYTLMQPLGPAAST